MRKKHLKSGLLSVLIAALMIFSSAYIAQVLPSGTAVIAEAASKTVHISNCKIKLNPKHNRLFKYKIQLSPEWLVW